MLLSALYNYFAVCFVRFDFVFCSADINECDEGTDNCSHRCFDADPGFTCGCENGYDLVHGSQCIGKIIGVG